MWTLLCFLRIYLIWVDRFFFLALRFTCATSFFHFFYFFCVLLQFFLALPFSFIFCGTGGEEGKYSKSTHKHWGQSNNSTPCSCSLTGWMAEKRWLIRSSANCTCRFSILFYCSAGTIVASRKWVYTYSISRKSNTTMCSLPTTAITVFSFAVICGVVLLHSQRTVCTHNSNGSEGFRNRFLFGGFLQIFPLWLRVSSSSKFWFLGAYGIISSIFVRRKMKRMWLWEKREERSRKEHIREVATLPCLNITAK